MLLFINNGYGFSLVRAGKYCHHSRAMFDCGLKYQDNDWLQNRVNPVRITSRRVFLSQRCISQSIDDVSKVMKLAKWVAGVRAICFQFAFSEDKISVIYAASIR